MGVISLLVSFEGNRVSTPNMQQQQQQQISEPLSLPGEERLAFFHRLDLSDCVSPLPRFTGDVLQVIHSSVGHDTP